VDSHELRLVLDKTIGGPGQYDDAATNPDKLYLPLADSSCRIVLTFRDKKIYSIEPGLAFDDAEWQRIAAEIESLIFGGLPKVGREYSFSGFRVRGSWRGDRSRVQILPPPSDAPQADVEMADHPFILEFPIQATDFWPLTNYRRIREHRNLTLLLNVLLNGGRTSFEPRRPQHFWADVSEDSTPKIKWVQQFFFAILGMPVIEELSPPAGEVLEAINPEIYYTNLGYDGKGLRVPTDLDDSICNYNALSRNNQTKFDRAMFWMDIASRQWNISASASFAALVSAIEALTVRGNSHQIQCPVCGIATQHEAPGSTRRFKDFLETYAPGAALASERDDMYSLRSGILHGSELMQLDQDRDFGWDPPGWNERELHSQLWGLTRRAFRNWLKNPP